MLYICHSPHPRRRYIFVILYQVWINQGDIILIGLRDYQDTKADVIIRYTPDEARNLKTYGELPESSKDMWFCAFCLIKT